MKHPELYYTGRQIQQTKYESIMVQDFKELETMEPNKYYVVSPHVMYDIYSEDKVSLKYNDVFKFSDMVIINYHVLLSKVPKDYISLHIRLGDKYLETKSKFCPFDDRKCDEQRIYNFIQNTNENIIVFCDSKLYKEKLKSQFNKIHILNSDVGHTSLHTTTEQQVLDGITEFYIMTKSKSIYAASFSGFSIEAAKFDHISYNKLY